MATRKLIRIQHREMEAMKQQMALIEQKKLELQMLQNGLQHFISSTFGVNLERQNWLLDLDQALLERQGK